MHLVIIRIFLFNENEHETFSGSSKQTDRTLSKHVKILLSPASSNAYMRVALSCRYPHVEVLLSRSATLHELIDKLTQYWQLHNHAQCVSNDISTKLGKKV